MDMEAAYYHGGTSAKDNLECLLTTPAIAEENEPFKTECPSLHIHYHGSGYVTNPRPYRDIRYVVLYALFVTVNVLVGLVAVFKHNPSFGLVDSALYNSSSGLCYIADGYEKISLFDSGFEHRDMFNVAKVFMTRMRQWTIPGFPAFQLQKELQHTNNATSLSTIFLWVLLLAVLLSVPIIFSLLSLLKAHPKQTVYTCLFLSILIPLGLNFTWFFTCMGSGDCRKQIHLLGRTSLFVLILVTCMILTWLTCSIRHRIELTIRLLQAAAQALTSNWGLLLLLPTLTFVLVIYILPFGMFMMYAYMNGGIVNMPGSYCNSDWATDCCRWKCGSWITVYCVLACATIIWSILIVVDAHSYIISSTVAQWYFGKTEAYQMGSIIHAVRSAFGPSFGTLCLSGSGLSFLRMLVKATLEGTEDKREQGCFFVVFQHHLADYARLALEFFSKFAINFAAVTGESYRVSARSSHGLLKFSSLSTDTVSTRLLSGMAFVSSFLYAFMVFVFLRACTDLEGATYYVTLLAWLVSFITLLYFCDALNNVIDALHMCYAMDKDLRMVSKVTVHEAFCMVLAASPDLPTMTTVHQPVQHF